MIPAWVPFGYIRTAPPEVVMFCNSALKLRVLFKLVWKLKIPKAEEYTPGRELRQVRLKL